MTTTAAATAPLRTAVDDGHANAHMAGRGWLAVSARGNKAPKHRHPQEPPEALWRHLRLISKPWPPVSMRSHGLRKRSAREARTGQQRARWTPGLPFWSAASRGVWPWRAGVLPFRGRGNAATRRRWTRPITPAAQYRELMVLSRTWPCCDLRWPRLATGPCLAEAIRLILPWPRAGLARGRPWACSSRRRAAQCEGVRRSAVARPAASHRASQGRTARRLRRGSRARVVS